MSERTPKTRWALALVLGVLVVVASPLALPGTAAPADPTLHTVTGVPIDPEIAEIWRGTDGPVASKSASRAWMWGPAALATFVEYSADSPDGTRHMVYYDKGRLDILDPDASPDSPWYVAGGLLVTQMLAGEIAFSDEAVVARAAPAIPVAGDLEQPNPLTYATLAPLATINGWPVVSQSDVDRRPVPDERIGQPVAALLSGDGSVLDDEVATSLTIGAFDAVTGHNIASPFVEWPRRSRSPRTGFSAAR